MVVVAYRTHQPAGGPDRGDIGRDVGGAAERAAGFPDGHHRHRRLGRQPLRVADEVAVQHHIADDHDAPALHPIQELDQPVAENGRRLRRGSHRSAFSRVSARARER